MRNLSRRIAASAAVTLCTISASARADDAPPVQAVAIGDFDGDGKPDVAVGLPDVSAGKLKKAGVVRIFSGATGALARTVPGTSEEQGYGGSLAAIGDSDGDGATDLAIAAPHGENGSYIDFVSGKTGKRIFRCSGGQAIAWADELCPLGDGSGKTRVDIAIRWVEKSQWRYVYSDHEAIGAAVTDDGGYLSSPVNVGDVDGDGKGDLAICKWNDSVEGKKSAGVIRIVSGEHLSQGRGAADILVLRGTRDSEHLGICVAAARDWDGDGKADVLAGVPGVVEKKTPWLVRVFSGKDGSELWRATGAAGDSSLAGVALVGDADGDGKPDVAVGTPGASSKSGAVSVISSKDGAVVWTVKGAARECLGEGLHAAADADGDGVADVVVLAPGSAVKGVKGSGYVRILSGKTGALLTQMNPLAAK